MQQQIPPSRSLPWLVAIASTVAMAAMGAAAVWFVLRGEAVEERPVAVAPQATATASMVYDQATIDTCTALWALPEVPSLDEILEVLSLASGSRVPQLKGVALQQEKWDYLDAHGAQIDIARWCDVNNVGGQTDATPGIED